MTTLPKTERIELELYKLFAGDAAFKSAWMQSMQRMVGEYLGRIYEAASFTNFEEIAYNALVIFWVHRQYAHYLSVGVRKLPGEIVPGGYKTVTM